MLNIVIPIASSSKFFNPAIYPYPKPLIEISGKPMIQKVIENLSTISEEKRFIFIIKEEDCRKFHLDSTLRLLAGESAVIFKIQQETMGAACSVLLAIDLIGTNDPLLIANGDQVIEESLDDQLKKFRKQSADAGCLCFDSVHPRWSYAKVDGENILETAEKRPISKHAIAGFFYFAKGIDFVESAYAMIRKDANVDGQYYVAPVLNELILKQKTLKAFKIENKKYHTFYSSQKIEEYEQERAR